MKAGKCLDQILTACCEGLLAIGLRTGVLISP